MKRFDGEQHPLWPLLRTGFPRAGKFDQLLLEARAGIVNWNKPLTALPVPRHSAALALPVTIAPGLVCRRLLRLADGEPGVGLVTLSVTLNPGLDFSDEVVR